MRRLPTNLAAMCVPLVLAACDPPRADRGPAAGPDTAARSPSHLAFSPDGRLLAVGDVTAGELVVMSVADGRALQRVRLGGQPAAAAWSADGSLVHVAVRERSVLAEIESASGKIRRWFAASSHPAGMAVAANRNLLLVADEGASLLLALGRSSGEVMARVAMSRTPWGVAVSPDERLAIVGHRLPAGDASDPGVSASVALIDLNSLTRVADIALPASSVNVHGVAVCPQGRWAYVVHTLARATWPATQIEYGGISANALSIIDLTERRRRATILLDQAERGCADPWGVVVSPDGKSLWVSLSGTHQMARLDLARLHAELEKRARLLAFLQQANRKGPVTGGVAAERSPLLDDPSSAELVVSEKPSAVRQGIGCACGMGVYLPGIIQRFDLPGLGPRGLAMSRDGRTLAVAMYFSGSVAMLDAASGKVSRSIALGDQPPPDAVRRGEIAFHDARLCHQQWLSCATCHPDGRADGLNWDLMNDGVGNPKNTRSLVLSHRTAPMMSRGARESFEAAVAAGFKHILFKESSPQVRSDVEAYLRSLTPQPSPFLVNDRLSDKTLRGKALFVDARVGCATCHGGELLTDLKSHDVGTHVEADWPEETAFVTPKLVELWRTAPYLHHGKAATLRDVLTTHNRQDRHGRTSHLKAEELEALVEYLRSL